MGIRAMSVDAKHPSCALPCAPRQKGLLVRIPVDEWTVAGCVVAIVVSMPCEECVQ